MLTSLCACAQNLVPFDIEKNASAAKPPVAGVCAFTGLRLPEDTIVIAAGSYSGRKLTFQIDQSGHEATQFDVAVHADKPVALILGAYEPTVWNIGWTKGTHIVAVYATGYHRQVLAGLPKGTPVLTPSYEERSPCGYNYVASEAQLAWLNPKARALFGKEVTRAYLKPRNGVIEIIESSRPQGELLTSADTSPSSFRDPKAPLASTAGLEDAFQKGLIRPFTQADVELVRQFYREKAARASPTGKPDIPPIAGAPENAPAPVTIPALGHRS